MFLDPLRFGFFLQKPNSKLPLHAWIWRSYVKAALIPMLFVELVLIGIYLFSHEWSSRENIEALDSLAREELYRMVENRSLTIAEQLESVAKLTNLFSLATVDALSRPPEPGVEDARRYRLRQDGILHSLRDDGQSAVWYSGIVPIGTEQREKVAKTARLDRLMKNIVSVDPLVAQAYFNTHDSFNRIWPYVQSADQFPAGLDVTQFNFYYEADAEHNPSRSTVWTNAYLDPAGKGWMVSSIAPVYRGDFLEGVVGLDITLQKIIDQVLSMNIPWHGFALLIGEDGTVLAMPEKAQALFKLQELTDYSYHQPITRVRLKPEEFNVWKNNEMSFMKKILLKEESGVADVDLEEPFLMSWTTLSPTGWHLVILAPKNDVLEPVYLLARRLS